MLGEHVRWVERDIHWQWYKLDRFVIKKIRMVAGSMLLDHKPKMLVVDVS